MGEGKQLYRFQIFVEGVKELLYIYPLEKSNSIALIRNEKVSVLKGNQVSAV